MNVATKYIAVQVTYCWLYFCVVLQSDFGTHISY